VAIGVTIVLFFLDLPQHTRNLRFQQFLKFLLSVLVQVVQLTKLLGQADRSVSIKHHNALTIVSSEIDVYIEEGRGLRGSLFLLLSGHFWGAVDVRVVVEH
jgi:hypothetical protein